MRYEFYPCAFAFLSGYKASCGIVKRYESALRTAQRLGHVVYFKDVNRKKIIELDNTLLERGYEQTYINLIHHVLRKCILQAVTAGKLRRDPYIKVGVW